MTHVWRSPSTSRSSVTIWTVTGKSLVVITGANQGGKSTFLRAVGLAQLMLQAGMFVGAETFAADARDGIFTHYKREEDSAMDHGKLDEELDRMSTIAGWLLPGSLLLSNESFASTNEREGSEIARQVLAALTESGVKVVFVTHLFDSRTASGRRIPRGRAVPARLPSTRWPADLRDRVGGAATDKLRGRHLCAGVRTGAGIRAGAERRCSRAPRWPPTGELAAVRGIPGGAYGENLMAAQPEPRTRTAASPSHSPMLSSVPRPRAAVRHG